MHPAKGVPALLLGRALFTLQKGYQQMRLFWRKSQPEPQPRGQAYPTPSAQSGPKEPGLVERAGRTLWNAYQTHQAKKGSTPAPLFGSARAHTSAEGAKNGYIVLIAAIAPFALGTILALGVGYFFAGFQPFSWTVPGVLAYGGGFAVEAVCLACFFASAKAFWGGQRWHFLAALVAALALSTISISSQILYLQLEGLKGAGQIPPGALDTIPVIGALVGNAGVGWVILARAIGFHIAEAACCFILAKSTESPEKRVRAMQAEQRAYLEIQRAERLAALERRIFEHAFTLFEQAEQSALQAPAKAPIAPLMLPQMHPESEGASNGHHTF